ncbi:hypothetical protein T01_10654 [Trichinella spiralis]|uniref:Uncharacterized protein n=1 Tax=Trichinella spiralis TaxID=6334 RepID=A0A0V1B750_TRISP|nr:hypothetical protein T01_10654 [Trichinella spiralis]
MPAETEVEVKGRKHENAGTLSRIPCRQLECARSRACTRIDPLDRKGKLAGKATNIGQSDPAHALVPEGTITPSVPQPEAQVEGPTKEQDW